MRLLEWSQRKICSVIEWILLQNQGVKKAVEMICIHFHTFSKSEQKIGRTGSIFSQGLVQWQYRTIQVTVNCQ